jgi:fructuronate reductase
MSDLLGLGAVPSLPAASRPRVTPGSAGPGIVHLGLGAFHRAHQAVYTEDALARGGGDWGIVGVAPRSPAVVDALNAQDLLYSVTTLDAGSRSTRVVGCYAGARLAAADPSGIVALLADPRIRIVTLTVTEKGYHLDPAGGQLLLDADLRAEIDQLRPPRTVPGLLLHGLRARQEADAGPIAIVSCDNLPANGRRLQGMVEQVVARAGSPALEAWVRASTSFPGSMVDRIVPATTPALLSEVASCLHVRDLAAVCGEPYSQWVIEDDFPGGRPAWDLAGAVLTSDASPWERLKLRTLNGVHSAIAYLGAVAGRSTIADALSMPGMVPAMRHYIASDVAPTLSPPPGVTVVEYGDSVLARFANPATGHRTVQVAMDGSQKLPQRMLHTIAERRASGDSPYWGALVVAAWMRFVQGVADDGSELPLDDPLAAVIRARLAAASSEPSAVVDALLSLDTVFSPALANDSTVRSLLVDWLTALTKHGVAATLAGCS